MWPLPTSCLEGVLPASARIELVGPDIQASFGYAGLLQDAVSSYFNESFSYLSVALPVISTKNKGYKKRTNKNLFCFYY
jgi:hypothetical protein